MAMARRSMLAAAAALAAAGLPFGAHASPASPEVVGVDPPVLPDDARLPLRQFLGKRETNTTVDSQGEVQPEVMAQDLHPEEEKKASSSAQAFLAYGFKPSSTAPGFLASTQPLFALGEDSVQLVNFLNLKSTIKTSDNTEEATKEVAAQMGVEATYNAAFSASVSASTNSMSSSKVQKIRADTYIKAEKYLATLTEPFPHLSLKEGVKDFLLKESPEKIVLVFGEFYVTKITLGGIFRGSVVKEVSSKSESQKLSAEFKANGGALTTFSVQGSASTDKKTSSLFEGAMREYRVQGGDVTKWLSVTSANADEVKSEWAQTVTSDTLAALGFEGLRPIWWLLDHDDMDRAKAKELQRYLQGKWDKDDAAARAHDASLHYKTTVTATTTLPVSYGWYSLKNVNSGSQMVVDCWNNWLKPCKSGTWIRQWGHNSLPGMDNGEHYLFEHRGDGFYTLKSAYGRYITADDRGMGAHALLRDSSSDAKAKWFISCPHGTGSHPCTLRNAASHHYLNVNGESKKNGAEVILWENPENRASQWEIHSAA